MEVQFCPEMDIAAYSAAGTTVARMLEEPGGKAQPQRDAFESIGRHAPKTNQDRVCVSHPFGDEDGDRRTALFAVFDGRGETKGELAADLAAAEIVRRLGSHREFRSNASNAMSGTVRRIHQDLAKLEGINNVSA